MCKIYIIPHSTWSAPTGRSNTGRRKPSRRIRAGIADGAHVEHVSWHGESRADYLPFTPEQLWYRRVSVAEKIDLMQDGPDGGAPTGPVSLAVGADGVARVAYASHGVVNYGVRTNGVWNVSIIDSGPSCGEWVSLAVDGSGRSPVIYRDAAN